MKFILSLVDSLDPCRHLLYTFQDVLSYHSNAVSEVAAASHAHRSIKRKLDQLGHFKWLKRRHSLSDFHKQGILV